MWYVISSQSYSVFQNSTLSPPIPHSMFLMKRDVQNTFGLSPNILIFYYIVSNFTAYMADSPGMTKFECNVPSELNLSLNILARILPSIQLTKIMEQDKPISEAPIIYI